MEIALWTAQAALALLFAYSGMLKTTRSRERLLATGHTGVAAYPMPVVRFAAICELAAVAGLLLPELTGIAPALTAWAAIGLAVVMVGAMAGHSRLAVTEHRPAEYCNVAANVLILAVCVFVAAGRW